MDYNEQSLAINATASVIAVKISESILKQKYSGMRIFFTIDEKAVMIIARKPVEKNEAVTVLSVTQLSADAKKTYNQYYDMLKDKSIRSDA